MSLDGIFLSKIKKETEENALNSRVDKISQPTRDEIIITLRGREGTKKLLLCTRTNCPRIHFITKAVENPQTPPMFCMLLRKYLLNAQIIGVKQYGLDRILFLLFSGTNEIGDKTNLTLCLEIMGTYSNIILIGENGKIIDAMRRIDFASSSTRQILPGIEYTLPEKQNKINLIEEAPETAFSAILSSRGILSKAVLNSIQGISPVIAREIACLTVGTDTAVSSLTLEEKDRLLKNIQVLKDYASTSEKAYIVADENGNKTEFGFLPVTQYGSAFTNTEYTSLSQLLEDYYFEKDRIERNRHQGQELFKTVNNLIERAAKKINLQKEDLKKCENNDDYKLRAELINANIYRLQKGSMYYDLENYYDNNKILRISADPMLTPGQNAQKYYKHYRKCQTARVMLKGLIEKSENELIYLQSVSDELMRASGENEIALIREELCLMGYIKRGRKNSKKTAKALEPFTFLTTDGFTVFVGRNNIQNDKLSMKQSNNHDMFLHVSKAPGSHVILVSDNREFTEKAIEEAAIIASCYSGAASSGSVNVDYTLVKNLKKPAGAKPGFVIYHEYNTILVKPDSKFVESLKQ